MKTIKLADFWAGLKIQTEAPFLSEASEVMRTAGGEVVVSQLGSRLWRSAVTIAPNTLDDGREIQARIRQIRQPGMSFMVSPAVGRFARLDPFGLLSRAAVTVASISADRTGLSLAGLPAGERLSVGDYISIDVAGIPHLHQLVASGRADALGATPIMEAVPPIRTSVSVGSSVTLTDPTYKAIMDPASVNEGAFARAALKGISFTVMQTLK